MTEKASEFSSELGRFAEKAGSSLSKVEEDPSARGEVLDFFAECMVAIRGTASQLKLHQIAKLAELGEEIAVKGAASGKGSIVRKCVGALWDALTTIKYMLDHADEESSEEYAILVNRLESTLKSMGGARKKVTEDELETLIKKRSEA